VTAGFTGRTDLDTGVYVFYGADGTVSPTFVTVPAFSVPPTNPVVVTGPPTIFSAPSSRTNSVGTTAVFNVGVSGAWPLSYRWYRNGTNALSDGGKISGAGSVKKVD